MPSYSLFGKLQIVEPNLAKRKNNKSFKKYTLYYYNNHMWHH